MSGPQAKYKQIPEEELRRIVSESTSMAQVIEKLGYSCLTGSAHASLKKYFEVSYSFLAYFIDTPVIL